MAYNRASQTRSDVVSLDGWAADEEFPIGPQGAKPKRIFICPNPPPFSFLVGGHRYLFKEPEGFKAQQIWSEVIAYQLSRSLDIEVPPAFLAVAPGNGSPGVLVEFFYGFAETPYLRFVHAIDVLQGVHNAKLDFKVGSMHDAIVACRLLSIPSWRQWWADTLMFDALIGNTDRHYENWGFLIDPQKKKHGYTLAPAFDNGTSLGYQIADHDIACFLASDKLSRFVQRGRHFSGWTSVDRISSQHAKLCRVFCDHVCPGVGISHPVCSITDSRIDHVVGWCRDFSFPLPFTDGRSKLVAALLRSRRDSIKQAM